MTTSRRVVSALPKLAALAALLTLLAATGCGDREDRTNVRPPAPGVPEAPSDVQGIYRTMHQGLLQLRGNGDFVLIVSADLGASAGTYTLEDGLLTVTTDKCGSAVGLYDVVVTGKQVAGEANLELTARRDPCQDRNRFLTLSPWIYAVS